VQKTPKIKYQKQPALSSLNRPDLTLSFLINNPEKINGKR